MGFGELIFEQEILLQRADGVSEEMIARSREFRNQIFAVVKGEKDQKIAEVQMRALFTTYLQSLTPSQRKIAESYYGTVEQQIQFFNSTWFRYSFAYEPVAVLQQLKIPVLALNGELDLVVSPGQNLKRIEKAFEEIGYKDYTVIELPKLNHALQTCQTGSFAECGAIEETVAPIALETVAGWVLDKSVKQK